MYPLGAGGGVRIDDSVESKHVAPLPHYMFNFTTVVFDGTSRAFYLRMEVWAPTDPLSAFSEV